MLTLDDVMNDPALPEMAHRNTLAAMSPESRENMDQRIRRVTTNLEKNGVPLVGQVAVAASILTTYALGLRDGMRLIEAARRGR